MEQELMQQEEVMEEEQGIAQRVLDNGMSEPIDFEARIQDMLEF